MAKYIDLEALVNWLKHIPLKDFSDGQGLCRVIMEDDFKAAISSLPESAAADVEPIVRGHWHVIKTSCAGMIATSYQCTVCGKTCATQMRLFHDDAVPTCCCWCGARMDKEAPIGSDTD